MSSEAWAYSSTDIGGKGWGGKGSRGGKGWVGGGKGWEGGDEGGVEGGLPSG